MKNSIAAVFALLLFANSYSQTDSLEVNIAFARIEGDWEGYYEFPVDGTTRTSSLPAKCTSKWDGKKWTYSVMYDEGEGEITGGKGEALASTDGKTILYNEALWNIIEVEAQGDSTTVILEITGKEKRKTVSTKHVILITSIGFFITEYRKEEGQTTYVFSNKHLFRRKK